MVIIRHDSSDDESLNQQQNRRQIPWRHRNGHANGQQNGNDLEENRGQIPWRHRNGHANDQHEVPFDGLLDENNNRIEMPENNDLANDLLEEDIINQYQRRNPRRGANIQQMNDDLEEFRRQHFIQQNQNENHD